MSSIQQPVGFLPLFLYPVACSELGVCLDFVWEGRTSAGAPGLEVGGQLGPTGLPYFQAYLQVLYLMILCPLTAYFLPQLLLQRCQLLIPLIVMVKYVLECMIVGVGHGHVCVAGFDPKTLEKSVPLV